MRGQSFLESRVAKSSVHRFLRASGYVHRASCITVAANWDLYFLCNLPTREALLIARRTLASVKDHSDGASAFGILSNWKCRSLLREAASFVHYRESPNPATLVRQLSFARNGSTEFHRTCYQNVPYKWRCSAGRLRVNCLTNIGRAAKRNAIRLQQGEVRQNPIA